MGTSTYGSTDGGRVTGPHGLPVTVPVWAEDPEAISAGKMAGWRRNKSYRAAGAGGMPLIKAGRRRFAVPTLKWCDLLGLDPADVAREFGYLDVDGGGE
jgi:hypothetical protein